MKFLIFLLLSTYLFTAFSQTNEDIFKDKKGDELLNLIVNQYKTSTVLSYNDARDQLWKNMAKINKDSLKCVYSGYSVYLSPNSTDPRGDAFAKDIDCEHTWPQSLGAETGNAKSDMHHLFPTWTTANSERGNLPFKEIPDNETDTWYRNKQKQSSKPTSKIDEYSEKDNNGWFEPREDHKGNVARAMVYFYTMYKSQSDKTFWEKQINTFYKWHYLDPVDATEAARNDFISTKQGGKKNPFILDSTLFRRAYFPHYKGSSSSSVNTQQNKINLYYFNNFVVFTFNEHPGNVLMNIYGLNGNLVYNDVFTPMNNEITFDLSQIPNGTYIYQLITEKWNKSGIIFNQN